MRYCSKCGAKLLPDSKFCSECGEQIENNNNNRIKTEKKSVNFIATGTSKIKTRDIYINRNKDSFEIEYQCSPYGKKMHISKIKNLNNFTTTISLISSLITVITFFLPINIATLSGISIDVKLIMAIITLLFATIASTSYKLLNNKSLKLPLNLEFKKIDDNYFSKVEITGKCPICGGKVRVNKKIAQKDAIINLTKEKYIGICENNEDHRFTFDDTIFKGERIK